MFSHIMVGADDVEKSKAFYDATLGALGHQPGVLDDKGRCFYFTPTGIFSITKPINGEPAGPGNGSTVGFAAADPAAADAWHAAGLASGGSSCEDPPGVREGAGGKLYLAYLRDPSGNKLCALHRLA
ncbi:MAG: VOC family protein [Halieaceae bacterium]|jgi:catechol 2,3-dioxygenase-like lactoylglutathione lyase family enzyme|nr:VOC family protein [Halieaceae bacterium]